MKEFKSGFNAKIENNVKVVQLRKFLEDNGGSFMMGRTIIPQPNQTTNTAVTMVYINDSGTLCFRGTDRSDIKLHYYGDKASAMEAINAVLNRMKLFSFYKDYFDE